MGGSREVPPPRNFLCASNCIFWCILGAILSATLLLDILHIMEVYHTKGVCKTCWNEKFKY